jgi:hypothetical protein
MKSVLSAFIFAILLQILASSTALAQKESTRLSAPRLFPEKTLAYLRIADATQLKADLAKSSLGKLGNDEQLKPILSEFYGTLVQATGQMQEAIGLNLDELLSIPSGEFAVALLPSDRNSARVSRQSGDGQERVNVNVETPAVAILLDAGEEIASVQVLLRRIESAGADRMVHSEKTIDRLLLHRYDNPNRQQEQFGYFIDNGVMVGCTDANYLEELARVWLGGVGNHKALADNRRFISIMSRCVGTEGERPHLSFFVDPLAIVRQFSPRNAGTTMVMAVLPALGLDGFEAIGGSWIVAPPDFDSIAHFHVLLASPRRSVLSLLRPKSGSTTPEDWIPDSVAAYTTINWDLASTLTGIENLFNQFRGDDALQQQVFQPASERLQLDLRKDILDNLEGRLTFMQGFVRPASISSGSNVYAIRMKNPDQFTKKVMPRLVQLLEGRFPVESRRFGELYVQMFKPDNRAPSNSTMRRPEICFAMIDDYLVISDSEYMMRQIADVLNGTTGRLADSLEYQLIADRITAQLQDKECSALSYAQPEESLQLFYELAKDPASRERLQTLSANNGFFTALLTALEKHELPPFSVIAKHLAPSGGFLVDDATGLHYMSFSLRRE